MLVCPTCKFLQLPAKSAFKRLILETPLYQHLLLTMSSTPTSELNNADCKKGHLSQWPPILYALSKDETAMKASRETIKMKTLESEVKVAVLGDSSGVVAMKKGGNKMIFYVVSNSYVILNFYLEQVCKQKCNTVCPVKFFLPPKGLVPIFNLDSLILRTKIMNRFWRIQFLHDEK